MAKKRNTIKTQSRTFNLPKNKVIDEWFNNQDNAGVSLNNGIILKIEEYGIMDYPLAIAKSYAVADKEVANQANLDAEGNSSDIQTKEKQRKTSSLYNEGPVLEWIEAQNNLSSSIGLLITDLIAQFGTSDLPLRLAWLSGRRNKYLNELSIVDNSEKKDNDIPSSNEHLEGQSKAMQENSDFDSEPLDIDLSKLSDPDLDSEDSNKKSLESEKSNSEKSDNDEDKIDLSILHDKSFFNHN